MLAIHHFSDRGFCEERWIRGSSPRMNDQNVGLILRFHLKGLPLFFILSKTIGFLLLPTNFLIGVGVIGAILLATRFATLGRRLVMASVLLLVVCGLSPLGNYLTYPLESRFPKWEAGNGPPPDG